MLLLRYSPLVVRSPEGRHPSWGISRRSDTGDSTVDSKVSSKTINNVAINSGPCPPRHARPGLHNDRRQRCRTALGKRSSSLYLHSIPTLRAASPQLSAIRASGCKPEALYLSIYGRDAGSHPAPRSGSAPRHRNALSALNAVE